MNYMKLVIPLHSLYWSIHTKDESKRGTAFAFIFGVNWLWRCGVTAPFGVFFHEIKCNGMTIFMEFMITVIHCLQALSAHAVTTYYRRLLPCSLLCFFYVITKVFVQMCYINTLKSITILGLHFTNWAIFCLKSWF